MVAAVKSNTNAIRVQVRKEIHAFCSSVNYKKRPTPIKYPYTIFEMKELGTEDGKTKCNLEVNIVSKNLAEAMDIADSIQDLFDHYSYLDDHCAFETYRLQRNQVEEEDKTIERLRLLFELNYHKREV